MGFLDDGVYDLAGYNTIQHNNQKQSTFSGQIVVLGGSAIELGASINRTPLAENNVVANVTNDKLCYTPNIGSVVIEYGENYWGVGTGSGTQHTISSTSDPMFGDVIVDAVPGSQSSSFITAPSMECGEGYIPGITKRKEHSLFDFSNEECNRLDFKGRSLSNASKYQLAYDTLQYFLENCPLYPFAAANFTTLGINAGMLVQHQTLDVNVYREWLKEVLYLNPSTGWYCSDAMEIVRSYWFPTDGDDWHLDDGNAAISVLKYLIDSASCTFLHNTFSDMWEGIRDAQRRHWRDTVSDSTKTPFAQDTMITKTLEELDLTILRGPKSGVVEEERVPRFGEMYVRRNPFTDVVDLRYELLRDTWSKVEVYDMLGRSLYTESTGFQPKGEHNITIDGRQWSSGTYYVRLSSVSGDVKTVKVMKE